MHLEYLAREKEKRLAWCYIVVLDSLGVNRKIRYRLSIDCITSGPRDFTENNRDHGN